MLPNPPNRTNKKVTVFRVLPTVTQLNNFVSRTGSLTPVVMEATAPVEEASFLVDISTTLFPVTPAGMAATATMAVDAAASDDDE